MEASFVPLSSSSEGKLQIVTVGDALTNLRLKEWLNSSPSIKTIATIDYHQARQQIDSLQARPDLVIVNLTGTDAEEIKVLQLVANSFEKVLVICRESSTPWLSISSLTIKGIILAPDRKQLLAAVFSTSQGECYFSASLLGTSHSAPLRISERVLHQWSCYLASLLLEQWRGEPIKKFLIPLDTLLVELKLAPNKHQSRLLKDFQRFEAEKTLESSLEKQLKDLKEIWRQQQFSARFESYANSIKDWLHLNSTNRPDGVQAILEDNQAQYTNWASGRLQKWLSQPYFDSGSQSFLVWAKSLHDSLLNAYKNYDKKRQQFLQRAEASAQTYYKQQAKAALNNDNNLNGQTALDALCWQHHYRLQEQSYNALAQSLKTLLVVVEESINVVEKTENLLMRLDKWLASQVKLEPSQKLLLAKELEQFNVARLKAALEEEVNCPINEWGSLTAHPTFWCEKLLALVKPVALKIYQKGF